MLSCQNNPNNSYTERKAIHESSGWKNFTNCSFDKAKNKLDYYRGIDCIKELSKKLKDHALKVIKNEKKVMIPLSEGENRFMKSKMYPTYVEESLIHIKKTKRIKKSKIIVITLENLELLLIIIVI